MVVMDDRVIRKLRPSVESGFRLNVQKRGADCYRSMYLAVLSMSLS